MFNVSRENIVRTIKVKELHEDLFPGVGLGKQTTEITIKKMQGHAHTDTPKLTENMLSIKGRRKSHN